MTTGLRSELTPPIESMPVDVQKKLADLKAGFVDRLMERCLEVDTLLQLIDRDGVTQRIREEIAQRAHKTAGVAKTFGFPELGDQARRVEQMWTTEFDLENLADCRNATEHLLDLMEQVMDSEL